MRLPDELIKGALFLTVEDSGRYLAAGTAFFLATEDPYCIYLVTARHCVRNAEKYGKLGVGVNTHDGRKAALWIEGGQWYFPESDADDVAVLPVPLNNIVDPNYDILPFFINTYALTDERAQRHGLGIGDEVVIAGLFTQSVGTKRMRPIIRSGIIAAMPDEPLEDYESGLPYHAYLAEVRSIGGLSGSPVFLVLPPGRIHERELQPEVRVIYLLGLVRGHFEKDPQEYTDSMRQEAELLNTGIAIVTPIQIAVDVIMNTDELVQDRAAQRKIQAKWDKNVGNMPQKAPG